MYQFIRKIKDFFFSLNQNLSYEDICPFCNIEFRYMRYSGMSSAFPHFYCNKCSSVIHRKSDFDKVMMNPISEQLLQEITESLPTCPCGGKFSSGANFKCPHCKKEIPNQYSKVSRLTYPNIVLVEGAKLFND